MAMAAAAAAATTLLASQQRSATGIRVDCPAIEEQVKAHAVAPGEGHVHGGGALGRRRQNTGAPNTNTMAPEAASVRGAPAWWQRRALGAGARARQAGARDLVCVLDRVNSWMSREHAHERIIAARSSVAERTSEQRRGRGDGRGRKDNNDDDDDDNGDGSSSESGRRGWSQQGSVPRVAASVVVVVGVGGGPAGAARRG